MKKENIRLSEKRKKRVRAKIRNLSSRLRLSVFRSNKYIYAQIIDDGEGKTLVAVSEKELKLGSGEKKTKIEKAKMLGNLLAQKALLKKIKTVVFDRGKYKFHGRVKALAEGAKDKGLVF